MAEMKTQPTTASAHEFINTLDSEQRRNECQCLCDMLKRITGCKPIMWGENIVGFGKYHYKYASGREGDWFLTGFSPRKQNLTLYMMCGLKQKDLLAKLGKHTTSVSCLYIKKLADIDLQVLEQIATAALKDMQAHIKSMQKQ